MIKTGRAVLDFGSGTTDATATVLDAAITSAARVTASIALDSTSTHTVDEHALEPIRVTAGDITAGTSFTIRGVLDSPGVATGTYRVVWHWSDT